MREFWLKSCNDLVLAPADFFAGARKIHRGIKLTYKPKKNDTPLTMPDCGFTKSKTSMLMRNYYVEQSIGAAVELWDKRISQDKYGSVGFHCYGHTKKGNVGGWTKYGSVMGPCLNAVNLTFMKDRNGPKTAIDVFYRTTELFKKWPADLVFLNDNLLPNFKFKQAPIQEINFHFANISITAMYAVTVMPFIDDPVAWLEQIRKRDPKMYRITIRWVARYFCKEHVTGILNHQQSLRTQKDAHTRITGQKRKELERYARNNWTPRDEKNDNDSDSEE